MKFLGVVLFFLGLLSLLLPLAGADFLYLKWTNQWGVNTSYAIRGGLMVVGALLWYLRRNDY